MSLAEDYAHLQASHNKLGEALAKISGASDDLEEATQQASAAVGDYTNVELLEALGMIAESSDTADDMSRMIIAAQNNIENYMQRMA